MIQSSSAYLYKMAIIEEIFEEEADQIVKVESLKKEGNEFFGQGEFEKAYEKYQVRRERILHD